MTTSATNLSRRQDTKAESRVVCFKLADPLPLPLPLVEVFPLPRSEVAREDLQTHNDPFWPLVAEFEPSISAVSSSSLKETVLPIPAALLFLAAWAEFNMKNLALNGFTEKLIRIQEG